MILQTKMYWINVVDAIKYFQIDRYQVIKCLSSVSLMFSYHTITKEFFLTSNYRQLFPNFTIIIKSFKVDYSSLSLSLLHMLFDSDCSCYFPTSFLISTLCFPLPYSHYSWDFLYFITPSLHRSIMSSTVLSFRPCLLFLFLLYGSPTPTTPP